jgi:hypothetical protein
MPSHPNRPFEPIEHVLQGRELMIALMGASSFRIEQGPNAHAPEKQEPESEHSKDEPLSVNYVETIPVKDGVLCDTYTFEGDSTRDLAIVQVEPGCKTPLQRVLKGTKTIEGFIKGKGVLTVKASDGTVQEYPFETDQEMDKEVVVAVGEAMQWVADKETGLVFYEICEPPYEDGRYENLSE